MRELDILDIRVYDHPKRFREYTLVFENSKFESVLNEVPTVEEMSFIEDFHTYVRDYKVGYVNVHIGSPGKFLGHVYMMPYGFTFQELYNEMNSGE